VIVDQEIEPKGWREVKAIDINGDGFVAFDDHCTHKGGPLSDGALACGTVQCPWHGSQFSVRTGEVQHGPAEHSIRVHSVVENRGRVWLRLSD